MTTLKNKNLRKSKKKLILIFLVLIIASLNLFGEDKKEGIGFDYYDYTNKLYHSTLKTEIIPSEYVFIYTYSYSNKIYYDDYKYKYENSYLYNLKTKEKKLFYAYKTEINPYEYSYEERIINESKGETYYYTRTNIGTNYEYLNEYYDIKGNLTTNWTDTNMEADKFYEITNNRFGETFYNIKKDYSDISIGITKDNNYIQKAYKYSLTQPEIINKKDRGIYLYLFGKAPDYYTLTYPDKFISLLCFQNEYYKDMYNHSYFEESGLLNYTNGRVLVQEYRPNMFYSYSNYDSWRKQWVTGGDSSDYFTNTIYFQLNNKSLIKPTWTEFTNNYLNYRKSKQKESKMYYRKKDIEINLLNYNAITDTKYLGFIPIEEFEYYLLAD